MARNLKPTDFTVTVDGIGTFTFGRRTMADEIAIQVEYARVLGGVTPTNWLDVLANWMAVLKTMTARAPDGWVLDELDPLEPETYAKISRVYDALTEKESSFRRQPAQGGEGRGAPAA